MVKRVFVLLICLVMHAGASAFSNTNMQNTLSGVIQAKMSQRGMQPNYPSVPSTLAAVGGAIAGYAASALAVTVAGATAPAWLTVGIAAGVGVLATAGLDWLLNSDGTVQLPGYDPNVPSGSPQPVHCFQSQCAATKAAACNRSLGTWSSWGYGGKQRAQWTGDKCMYQRITETAPPGEALTGTWYDIGEDTGYRYYLNGCPGIDLNSYAQTGTCPASNFPVEVGEVVPYSEAVDAISPTAKQEPVNPQIIADLANKMWMGAASQPGYDGVAFDAANPITAADVNTWRQQNPTSYPSLGDLFTPQVAPAGGTSSTPWTMPASPTPQAESGPASPSTSTNPASENPLTNLGPDPNIGMPTLEEPPTVAQILDPVFSLFPSVRSFVVPQHTAVCPKPSLMLFAKNISFDSTCTVLEEVRALVTAAMAFIWAFLALRITLSA